MPLLPDSPITSVSRPDITMLLVTPLTGRPSELTFFFFQLCLIVRCTCSSTILLYMQKKQAHVTVAGSRSFSHISQFFLRTFSLISQLFLAYLFLESFLFLTYYFDYFSLLGCLPSYFSVTFPITQLHFPFLSCFLLYYYYKAL